MEKVASYLLVVMVVFSLSIVVLVMVKGGNEDISKEIRCQKCLSACVVEQPNDR